VIGERVALGIIGMVCPMCTATGFGTRDYDDQTHRCTKEAKKAHTLG